MRGLGMNDSSTELQRIRLVPGSEGVSFNPGPPTELAALEICCCERPRGCVLQIGGRPNFSDKLASSTSELATSWDANQFTGNRIDSVFQSSSVPDCVRCYAHLGALAPGRDLYIHGGDADDSRGHCACHILKPACCRTAAPKGVWQLAGWFS